ncbi:MAG: NUDIX hydrolase [Candidatus Gracilibacteria bacterium]|nr:NUDIX hydrolase [Candidatus Gracilibacteria bacterium]
MFKIFVRAVIKNEKGEFILVKKLNSQKVAPGKSLFPGGTLEFGEEVEDCLVREIQEEIGLDVIESRFIVHENIMLDGIHWLGCYYECKTSSLDFTNMEPDKHEKVFWGNVDNLGLHGKNILKYL